MVPNEFPTQADPSRSLAIVGEAPGKDETTIGKPFVGASGQLLNACLSKYGMPRSACFVGNVCQERPPGNDINAFAWDGPEIQKGLGQLAIDIAKVNPNIVLLLGASALKASGVTHSILDYRGSIFVCRDSTSPFFNRKCIAALHPAAILRMYSWSPLLKFDVARAIKQSYFPDYRPPVRHLHVDVGVGEAIERLRDIKKGDVVSTDIEGGIVEFPSGKPSNVSVISFAKSATYAFTVNLREFSETDLVAVYPELYRVLADHDIGKILQNSLYDNFVMTYLWRIPINGVMWDTMLSGHELYPEMKKSLAVQTSLYTEEPFYKFERKITDNRTHYLYCAKDACVTYEIAERHSEMLQGESLTHFQRNMKLLPICMFMELKGMRIDVERKASLLNEIQLRQSELQARISVGCGTELNCNSPKQMADVLYSRMGYPPQYTMENGRRTNTKTANKEALLQLVKSRGAVDPFLFNVLYWRHYDGMRKQLEMEIDPDNRVRGEVNVVGTKTGRFTVSGSPTGTGTNLQAIAEDTRVIFCADPGYTMFQFDFRGADGWTVAAHCNRFGDDTMMQDYIYGDDLKPAKIIAAMHLKGAAISRLSRPELAAVIKTIDFKKEYQWLYFTCKQVQHGSNYELGPNKMSSLILMASWAKMQRPMVISPAQCAALQKLYFIRYWGVKQWQAWAKKYLETHGAYRCPSGNLRTFFDRRHDHETYREFLSHEPQHTTTDATTRAMLRLWEDPENRDISGAPIIQILHQVHDALIGQFPSGLTSWAKEKLNQCVQNPITIAGQSITIPAELKLGPNWGELK